MANSTPAGMEFWYDDAAGTPVEITDYVMSINDIDVENISEESNPFGVVWKEHKLVGLGQMPIIEIGGLYETIANGPQALFGGRVPEGPAVAKRTFKIVWLTGYTTSVETNLLTYRRSPDRNGLTKYTVRLEPSGAVTEVVV